MSAFVQVHERILIAHAQAATAASLAQNLEVHGYGIVTASDGYAAWSLVVNQIPDLLLLDWDLPGLASDDLCRRLRGNPATRHVQIFALCKTANETCALFDACVPSPCPNDQLVLRVDDALKRRRQSDTISCGDIEVDRAAYRVRRGGKLVRLSGHAFKLLCFLILNPDQVHTREILRDRVWGKNSEIDERTIDVHVAKLRRGLFQSDDFFPVRTVQGVGYALDSKLE